MTTHLWRIPLAAARLGLVLGLSSAPLLTGGHRAQASAGTPPRALQLILQELALAVDAPLTIVFRVNEALAPEATVVVSAYQRVSDRGHLTAALSGDPGRTVDTVDLPLSSLARTEIGAYQLVVPTESTQRTAPALELPKAGLYPLFVTVKVGSQIVAVLRTVVDRLQTPDQAPLDALQVALVATLSTTPAIPGSPAALPAQVLADAKQLTTLNADTTMSLSISADLLSRIPGDVLDQLRPTLQRSQLLSQTRYPLDPSVAAAAGQQDLFQKSLVEGEDRIADLGEVPLTNRTAWISPATMGVDGAAMLRGLGVGNIVLTPTSFEQTSNGLGFADTSQVIMAELDEGSVRLGVIDLLSANLLESRTGSLEQRALIAAADLIVKRDELTQTGVIGHTLFVGAAQGGVPEIALLNRIVEMTEPSGAIRYLTLDQAFQSTHQLTVDGLPYTVVLPEVGDNGLAARVDQLAVVQNNALTTASMLPDDDPDRVTWSDQLGVLTSTAIRDDEASAAIAAVEQSIANVRSCVVAPSAFSFTLSGTKTTIPIVLRNTCERPIKVKVNTTSPKMSFPAGDQIELVPPKASTDVEIPAAAQSNGSFGVELRLLTPEPDALGRESLIGSPVTLKARVNTLTGLAQVLTGGGLLMVMTWWLKNARDSRRKKMLADLNDTHPARFSQRGAVTAELHNSD